MLHVKQIKITGDGIDHQGNVQQHTSDLVSENMINDSWQIFVLGVLIHSCCQHLWVCMKSHYLSIYLSLCHEELLPCIIIAAQYLLIVITEVELYIHPIHIIVTLTVIVRDNATGTLLRWYIATRKQSLTVNYKSEWTGEEHMVTDV